MKRPIVRIACYQFDQSATVEIDRGTINDCTSVYLPSRKDVQRLALTVERLNWKLRPYRGGTPGWVAYRPGY